MAKAKKIEIKTKDNYTKDEMKRYLGALSENHNEHLKAINKNFIIVNRKLDEHTKILNRHEKILNRHDEKLDSHTKMIGGIATDVSVLKDDMQVVKKELKRKVDYDEFILLVKRVNKLEAKI